MRLTIVNLLIQSGNEGERKHSATILARKLFELNPPYAGPAMRPMLHIGTRMRGSKMKPPLRRRGHNGAQTPSSFLRKAGTLPRNFLPRNFFASLAAHSRP